MSRADLDALFHPPKDTTPVVEDVTMDDRRKTEHRAPCARKDLKCGECGALMILRKSRKFGTPFYGCSRFPECRGTHGAHPDGRPRGIPGDRKTNEARNHAREFVDRLWKRGLMTRNQAHAWMRQTMKTGDDSFSSFTIEQCEHLVQAMQRGSPVCVRSGRVSG